jgi:transaldolase
MFDFFFDTADDEYVLRAWDKLSTHFEAHQIRGITTNPNAFKKIQACRLREWEEKLVVLCSLVSDLRGDNDGVVYVQTPSSLMSPEQVLEYAKHISQFNDGKTKLGLKIPPFYSILEIVDELNKYTETNVTGLADCSTALSCLSYNVRYISLIPGRMEEQGLDAKAHVLFARRYMNEGTSGASEIIAGSMRTIEGLEWVCSHGTVPTIGTRVWDKILEDEKVMRRVAAFGTNVVSCSQLQFSPHVTEINTKLSLDFFEQMNDCGRSAYEDFTSRNKKSWKDPPIGIEIL